MIFYQKLIRRIIFKLIQVVNLNTVTELNEKTSILLGFGSGASSTREEINAIRSLAQKLSLTEIHAVDAGANIGSWTKFLLQEFESATVILFEPSDIAFLELQKNLSGYSNLKFVNSGLGAKFEIRPLYTDFHGSGLASVHKRNLEHLDLFLNVTTEITIHSLDLYLYKNFPEFIPNLLKMDVEGFEMEVLKGAKETLKKLSIVQFEFGGCNLDSRDYFKDFWNLFKELGFDVYRLAPSGLIHITKYSENLERFTTTNYFAIRV